MTNLYLPPIAIWVIATLLGALVLIRVMLHFREHARTWPGRGMLLVRLAVLLAIGWMLLNPTQILPRQHEGKPRLTVLIDTSGSMAVQDVENAKRLQAATASLAAALPSLEKSLDVSILRFDGAPRPVEISSMPSLVADGTESFLAGALRAAVQAMDQDKTEGGLLLLSDGRSTETGVTEAAEYALSQSIPVWTVPFGGSVTRRDVALDVAQHEAIAFASETVRVQATLRQEGYPSRRFAVTLLADDAPRETKEIQPDADGIALVDFAVAAPEKGTVRLVLRTDPLPDEADASNNEQSVFLRVIDGKPSILVAEGQPHWDTKFLVQSLNANPHLGVTAVYRVAANRHVTITSGAEGSIRKAEDAFPRKAEDFDRYDMIILGRGMEPFFSPETEKLLTEWTSRGGRLVFARGKPYGGRFPPLAKFEPVIWSDGAEASATLVPAKGGESCPVFRMEEDMEGFLASLPRFDLVAATQGSKSLSTVWATSDAQRNIIMASSRYGLGQTLTLNAGGFWRWAFQEKRTERDEQAYDRFWNALIRWLLSEGEFPDGTDVSFTAERRVVTDNLPLRFLVRTRGDAASAAASAATPEIVISRADAGEPLARMPLSGISEHTWTGQAGPFPAGRYVAELHMGADDTAMRRMDLDVMSSSRENRNLSADPQALRTIASTTGARTLVPEELGGMGDIMASWHAQHRIANERQSQWDRGWILVLLLLALTVEWLMRRREGLL